MAIRRSWTRRRRSWPRWRLAKDVDGRLAITRIVLRPRVAFGGDVPGAEEVTRLHARAHAECFIANSVRTEVVVEPR